MKVKLFTHTDLDGIACAIVGILAFGKENIDIEYCDYANINEKVCTFLDSGTQDEYNMVYITDISVDPAMAVIVNVALDGKVMLLDHHKTAEWLNQYKWAHVNETTVISYFSPDSSVEKTCGAYEFFVNLYLDNHIDLFACVHRFVDTVRKYDTWLWKTQYNDSEPKQWNDLLYLLGRDRFIQQVVAQLQTDIFCLVPSDQLLLQLNQENIDRYIESKDKEIVIRNIRGYRAGVVFAEQYTSELGNRLAEAHKELDFIAIINPSKAVSYRTTKADMDLSNLAKIFGGGGHPSTSGSPITELNRKQFIDIIFN